MAFGEKNVAADSQIGMYSSNVICESAAYNELLFHEYCLT